MEMAGSSKVSEKIESKYDVASAVNVSSFVSVKKLNWLGEYRFWKSQMINLIESWELLHIIINHPVDESVIEDVDMTSKFDKLVKGWILGTLGDYFLEKVQDLGTAREVWMKLDSIFDNLFLPQKINTEEVDPAKKLDEKYRKALGVQVSNYVSVTLSGRSNYHMWKAQMLCLLEDKKLLHIIIAEYPFPEDKGVHMIPKYDKLVKGWILASMYKELLEEFIEYSSVQLIWKELESRFNRPIISYIEEGGSLINGLDVSALREDLKYIQVSNINVSNFVSVKLSGHSNYNIWQAQMMCLLESQELVHIIEVEARNPWNGGHMTKKYDNLVLGWIFGTMNDQLLQTFTEYDSVQELWKELEEEFNSSESDSDKEGT